MQKPTKTVSEQEFYSSIYKDSTYVDNYQYYAEYLINRVDLFDKYKNKRILDAGCGFGLLAKELKRRFSTDSYGLDINPEGIAQAKKGGIKAYVGNLEEAWPFKDNFFDGIVSMETIEHLFNPDFFLSEAHRVLKPNGLLVLTTPNLASWFNRAIFLFGYQPFTLEASTIDKTIGLKFTRKLTPNRQPLGHVRGFTLCALNDILELHNFKVIKSYGGEVDYLPSYMNKLNRAVFTRIPSLAADLIVVAEKK